MRAIIIDDEVNAISALKGVLEEYFKEITIVATATHIVEGAALVNEYHPHLVFIDINMPVYSGFDLKQFLLDDTPDFHAVFVTGHSDYALKAYEHNATDYLLKPVKAEEIERLLRKITLLSS